MVIMFDKNKVINGTFGRLWWDGELLAECKKFEAKVTGVYESVNIAEELGERQKYMGFTGAGTAVLSKIDSVVARKAAEGFKTGKMPEFKLVGRLSDPNSDGQEAVELIDVTLDEMMLIQFEVKALSETEIPFKFADFNYLDII